MNQQIAFQFAHLEDETSVRQLLRNCGLPDDDIHPHIRNFLIARDSEQIVGTVGLEIYDDVVFLRSLSVAQSHRKHGIGHTLTSEIVNFAKHLEAQEVYLLTETAEQFFEREGFSKIPREQAPSAIQSTTQFTTLCPSSATLMRKKLD